MPVTNPGSGSGNPTSLDELEAMAQLPKTIENSPLENLVKTSRTLLERAENEGQDEKAYTYFMKYANLHFYIKKRAATKIKDRKYYELMMSNSDLEKAVKAMEKLKPKLKAKFNAASCKKKSPEIQRTPKIVSKSMQIPEILEPKVLFDFIKEKSTTFLILDCRPLADYRATRIKVPNVISVSEEMLEPGTTASKIERKLNVEDRSQFGRRTTVDVLILMDWLSEGYEDSGILEILKDSLTKWDHRSTYKSRIHLLKGGLENFSMHYPHYVTDPQKVRSHPKAQRPKNNINGFNRTCLLNINELQYPDLNKPDANRPPSDKLNTESPDLDAAFVETPSPQSSPLNGSMASSTTLYPSSSELSDLNKAFVSGAITLSKEGSPKRPSVPDRATKPATSADQVRSILNKDKDPTLSHPPTFDRKLKAKLLVCREGTAGIKEVIDAEADLVDDSLELENQQLELERRWEVLKIRREKEAEEEMKLEVMKKEEQLLQEIQKLSEEKTRRDRENEELRTQLQKMRLEMKESENSARRQQVERENQKEEELLKIKEAERQRLKQEIEQKRKERMRKQEVEERKRKVQESMAKRQQVERELEMKLSLNRSHSSPNIAKMLDDEPLSPAINRATKPDFSASAENDGWQKQMARYRDFQPVFGTGRVCLTGLKNLGNTCYMNSILQCLSNLQMPTSYFLDRQILRRDLNPTSSTKGNVAIEFAEVLRNLRSGQYNSIVPTDFKAVIGRYKTSFRTYDQQDAHELLNNLIVWLHNDLNEVRGAEKMKLPEQNNDGIPGVEAAKRRWKEEKSVDKSFIRETFYGQWRSILRCPCGWESVSYEPFFEMALQLPPGNGRCSLNQCIEGFLKPEPVPYKCPECKRNRECSKRFEIVRLPSIVIIQLVRFYNDGLSRKRQNCVDFDLNGLNLGRYATACDGKLNRYHHYNLVAVCNHMGSMEGGHYTAYCRPVEGEGSRWHKYDDHEVYDMDLKDVKSSKAYILFYSAV